MRGKIVTGALGLFSALCALELLRASFAAFTWGKFTLFDYGVYTNMIWNSGQGDFFRVLLDRSYLTTHLSFTLVLLGPLYRLWNHPFLLAFLQWLMLMAGGAVLGAVLYRRGIRMEVTAALFFFYTAYPYSQSVVLSEFHGVSLYLFLLPLLYAFLSLRKGLAWIPLLLVLGMREDAFLVVLPMLLYFAARERWKGGYLYAFLSLAYGVFALLVLYPWINEISIFARRSREIGIELGWDALVARSRALLWVLIPTLIFIPRRWLKVMLFPSFALATAMASGFSRQYQLEIHYPAAIMACLAVGMAESMQPPRKSAGGRAGSGGVGIALWLVGVTLVAHFFIGFLPGGGRSDRIYRRIHPDGLKTLQAAGAIPEEGTLIVPLQLAAFVANRADLLTWRTYDRERHTFDLVFSTLQLFAGARAEAILQLMDSGEFGVRYFDGSNFILQRGYDTSGNEELKLARLLARRTIRLANTHREAGSNREAPGALSVRFWEGSEEEPLPLIAYGRGIDLPPGSYEARLRLRASRPETGGDRSWGSLGLYPAGGNEAIAETELERRETPAPGFRVLLLPFELAEAMEVEPRVRAGAAPLWLDTVVFASRDEH